MNKQKMISVIVPVYQVSGYVENCIESIQNQTYQNLEILLVDDGSTDGSGEICDRYAAQDSRVRVFHKENGGLSDARNYALDRARGEWVGFVDGDDWIHPQMYELLLGILLAEQADVSACGFVREKRAEFLKTVAPEKIAVSTLSGAEALIDIETPLVVAWNKLYRREIFRNIRYPKGRLHEDEFVIHRIFRECTTVAILHHPFYFYTVRENSIVAQMTPKRVGDSLDAFADRVAFAEQTGWTEVLPAVVKRYCDYCIDCYEDIQAGRYQQLDDSYLIKLWQAERNMIKCHRTISIDRKYRAFAISPLVYAKWKRWHRRLEQGKRVWRKIRNAGHSHSNGEY